MAVRSTPGAFLLPTNQVSRVPSIIDARIALQKSGSSMGARLGADWTIAASPPKSELKNNLTGTHHEQRRRGARDEILAVTSTALLQMMVLGIAWRLFGLG